MIWERISKFYLESDEGYLIRACQDHHGWGYLVMGPVEKVTRVGGADFFRDMEYKVQYQAGDRVPPSCDYDSKKARLRLGFAHEREHGSTDGALASAKQICLDDFKIPKVLPGYLAHGSRTPRKNGGGSQFLEPDNSAQVVEGAADLCRGENSPRENAARGALL